MDKPYTVLVPDDQHPECSYCEGTGRDNISIGTILLQFCVLAVMFTAAGYGVSRYLTDIGVLKNKTGTAFGAEVDPEGVRRIFRKAMHGE